MRRPVWLVDRHRADLPAAMVGLKDMVGLKAGMVVLSSRLSKGTVEAQDIRHSKVKAAMVGRQVDRQVDLPSMVHLHPNTDSSHQVRGRHRDRLLSTLGRVNTGHLLNPQGIRNTET